MTRGRCGSLVHIRMTFAFTTPRRFNRRTRTMQMRYAGSRSGAVFFLGMVLLASAGLGRAQSSGPAVGTVTFTVTAVSNKESIPPISKDDVQLCLGRERRPIGDLGKTRISSWPF